MRASGLAKTLRVRTWSEQIQERLESGQTIKAFCEANGISTKTYYYRLNRVRESYIESAERQPPLPAAEKKPEFAEFPVPAMALEAEPTGTVTVTIGPYRAEVSNGADFATVENVLRALAAL